MKLLERSQIENKYKWDLSAYFKSDSDWETAFKQYDDLIKKIINFKEKLNEPKIILDCLKLQCEISKYFGELYIYAALRRDEDITISKNQERCKRIENKNVEYSKNASFIIPELSKLDNSFLKELIRRPDYVDYDREIEFVLRIKKHTLGEKEEKIMASMGSFSRGFKENMSMFNDGDLKFNDVYDKNGKAHEITHSSASAMLRDSDRTLRKNAYSEYKGAYGRYNDLLASNYLNHVRKNVMQATVRNFNSVLESQLYYEEIDAKIYNTLIKSVNSNLSLYHRYFEARRKMLMLDKFALHDIYFNPPVKSSSKFSYEQAQDLVKKSVAPIGNKYVTDLADLYSKKCIDVMPNKNKCSGAYAWGAYGKPPVVLLNFKGLYNDVSTLAHEIGHAMHNFYSCENQPITKADYVIFMAEIASNVNECLLNRYMLNKAETKEEKLFYITEFLSNLHASVFRQTMFAEFEAEIHNKCENNQPLSAEVVNNTYYDLVKKYFGSKIELTEGVKYEWSSIPHFYSSFYVYKYASGLLIAVAIVNNIINSKSDAAEKYMKLLSGGSCKDPVTLLKEADIDLTKKETFDKAFSYFEDYLKQFEELIK